MTRDRVMVSINDGDRHLAALLLRGDVLIGWELVVRADLTHRVGDRITATIDPVPQLSPLLPGSPVLVGAGVVTDVDLATTLAGPTVRSRVLGVGPLAWQWPESGAQAP